MPALADDPSTLGRPARTVIDSNVLYGTRYRRSISALHDASPPLIVPIWSVHIASEVTRVLLYEKWQDRGTSVLPRDRYEEFARLLRALIDQLDYRYELYRVAGVAPTPAESQWASDKDPTDLHLQLLGRVANADYVVSGNTRDFPNLAPIGAFRRGTLGGLVWIHPADLLTSFGVTTS